MQRNLNRALLATLMARTVPAMESTEDVVPPVAEAPATDVLPEVVPAEAASATTAEAVAAATGEAGVPETPPVAETTAPIVHIKVEVEQASKPAGGDAATAAEIPPEPVADVVPEASGTEVPPAAADAAVVDAVPAAAAAVDAGVTPGVDAPAAEVVIDAPAAGDATPAASAAAPTEEAPVAAAPAAAEAPAEGAAEVPVEGATEAPVEGGEPAAPAEGATEEAPAAAAEAPAATDEVPPAEGAAAEPAAGEAGEVAPEAPASGEAATEPAAEVPPVEGGEAPAAVVPAADGTVPPADAPPVDSGVPSDSGEPATDIPVDAKPTEGEKDAAAEEVQAAIDEGKKAGDEGAEAAVAKEDLVVTSELTPIGDTPDVINADQIAPELEEMATELNAYQDGSEAMDRIGEIASAAAEEGGLDKTAAQILEVAVEHIHSTLKLGPPIGILAMEAYDDQSTRGSATSIALEEIARTAKEIWESIKAGIAKFVQMAIGFYDRLVSGALIQQQQAQAMIKSAEALGDKSVQGTIKSAALTKALARGNAVSKSVPQDLMTTSKVIAVALTKGSELAQSVGSLLANEAGAAVAKEKLVQLVQQHVASVLKPDGNLSDVGIADAPQGTIGYATLPLLGNNVLWAYVPKTVADLGSMAFGRHSAKVEVSGDELPILSTSEVKFLSAVVLDNVKTMAELNKCSRVLKDFLNQFNTFASQSANADAKPDPVLTKAVHQLSAGLAAAASKLAFANNSAALSYCKASMAKLQPQAEAAPAAAAPAAA